MHREEHHQQNKKHYELKGGRGPEDSPPNALLAWQNTAIERTENSQGTLVRRDAEHPEAAVADHITSKHHRRAQ